MTKYKQLVEKIVEAVPEIMKLEFGCGVSGQGIHNGLIIDRYEKKTEIRVEVGDYKVETINRADWLHTMEILGRPITLEDVLRAGRCKLNASNFYITSQSKDTIISIVTDDYGDLDWWLHKPLSEQSKETIEFLYKLLCQTE